MRKSTYRILAKDKMLNNNTWQTGLNNNDIIIGPSGAGKTRSYVIPNILQCNESMIIADTKGSVRKQVEDALLKKHYKIIEIDLTNLFSSYGYNPFDFIRYDEKRDCFMEQDIMTVASCIVPVETIREPFWEMAARQYLECLITYVLETLPQKEHTLESVVKLFFEMGTNKFSVLIRELQELNPNSFAVMRYRMFEHSMKADKMHASILGVLAEKISIFAFDGAKALFDNSNRINFADLGKEKTAVFLKISDTDRSMDRIGNLFYTQALHMLCFSADKDYNDNRLKIPVRFILDDFASNVYISEFDKIISVIRSREIYVSIIIQSLSQLESMYGEARAKTILNNCDNLLYLGGQDVGTAQYIAKKANKSTSSILNMSLDNAWLFTRGIEPQCVQKYNLFEHKNYKVS